MALHPYLALSQLIIPTLRDYQCGPRLAQILAADHATIMDPERTFKVLGEEAEEFQHCLATEVSHNNICQ